MNELTSTVVTGIEYANQALQILGAATPKLQIHLDHPKSPPPTIRDW